MFHHEKETNVLPHGFWPGLIAVLALGAVLLVAHYFGQPKSLYIN